MCGVGGAERIYQYFCEEFPDADAYVMAHNPAESLPYFATRGVRTTWLNGIVRSMESARWAFPVATYVWESLDLRQYDVVLTSSAHSAKYARVPNGAHVCYCYFPTRAIWHREAYFGRSARGKVFDLFLPYLRRRDLAAANRIDRFVAISQVSRDAIKQYYDRDSEIIFPPIELDRFAPGGTRKEHYLIVSRLEGWKRVDYAIEAFNKSGRPLRIVGTGKLEAQLRAMAKPNITFVGKIDDAALAREYQEARAVIFTPHLEYGLIPLEANASGTPVICYGRGGITETMIPSDQGGVSPTAVFFYDQTPDALNAAVTQFEQLSWSPSALARHAAQWGVPEFKRRIRDVVESAAKHRN